MSATLGRAPEQVLPSNKSDSATLSNRSTPSATESNKGHKGSASENPLGGNPGGQPRAPALLLSPKSAGQKATSPNRYHVSTPQQSASTPPASNMASMIERMHHVEERHDHPAKKLKRDHMLDQPEQPHRLSTFNGTGKGGLLSDYAGDKSREGTHSPAFTPSASRPALPPTTIDLTADEDDDVIVVRDTGTKEVCLGKLERPYINAYQVPQQKVGGHQGSKDMWPPMNITFRRSPSSGNNVVITACDPRGQAFGSVDPKTSHGLAPLLDTQHQNGLRVSAKIEPRRKRPGEIAGQTLPNPVQMFMLVILYSPRRFADAIGTYLSKRQLWLRMPPSFDSKTDYYNPQAPNVARTKISTGNGVNRSSNGSALSNDYHAGGTSYVTRTVEEIRNDVISMFDSLTKTEDLPQKEQDPRILTKLLAHQKQALFFMTDKEKVHNIQEDGKEKNALWTVKSRPNGRQQFYNVITGYTTPNKPPPVRGGILADMMGLGKTLSILSLVVDTLSEAVEWQKRAHSDPNDMMPRTKATLLVCPVSTVANWEEQLKTHIEAGAVTSYIYHGSNRTKSIQDLQKYDLVITTYSVAAADFGNARSKKPLQSINWFRIVLDEAHMIRTQSTRQSKAICVLEAERRWAVTGTPVQNRLDDLGALIKFLRIKPFDEKGGFTQFILTPFKNADAEILPKLRLLVDSITLRRMKDKINLPKRHDQLVRLQFSDEERKLYDWFARDATSRVNAVTGDRDRIGGRVYVHILRAILRLRLICAHGTELLSDEDLKLTEGLSYGNAIDLGDEDDEEKPAISARQAYDMLHLMKESDMDACSCCQKKLGQPDSEEEDGKVENTLGFMTPCFQIICPKCMPAFRHRVSQRATADNYMTCPICEQYVRISFFELLQDQIEEDEQNRAKLQSTTRNAKQLTRYGGPHTKTRALLQSLLENRQWSDEHPDEPPLKSVVFSGWTTHLDLIEIALNQCKPPLPYCRLDGRMSRKDRGVALETFRVDPSVPIMLVSIAAGGLGLNLTSASRAYVMEPQFNPAAEAQAVDRVHRLGQTREVVITRFIMQNSFEEKMLELQQKKMQLAELSLSKGKLDRGEEQKRKLEDLRSLFR